MTKEQAILASNFEACRQRIEKLKYSMQKNAVLFPLTPALLASLSEEQKDISAYLERKGLVTIDVKHQTTS